MLCVRLGLYAYVIYASLAGGLLHAIGQGAELPPVGVEAQIASGGIPKQGYFGMRGSVLIVDGSVSSTGGSVFGLFFG